MRLVALGLLLALPALEALPVPSAPEGPVVLVRQGAVRLLEGERARTLGPDSGNVRLAGADEVLALAPASALDLVWRGSASATLTGPAELTLSGPRELRFSSFRDAELEVRRGTLGITLVGYGTLDLGGGVLSLRSLSGTHLEITNRDAETLSVRLAGGRELRVPPGRRLRLRRAGPEG